MPRCDFRHGSTLSGRPGTEGTYPMVAWPLYRYRICVQGMIRGMPLYCQGHPVDMAHIVPGPSYRRSTCVQGGMPLGMGLHCQGFPVEMAHALQVAWPSYRYRICVHGMTPGMHLHS